MAEAEVVIISQKMTSGMGSFKNDQWYLDFQLLRVMETGRRLNVT